MAATVEALCGDFAKVDLSRAAEDAWRLVQRLNRLVEERAPGRSRRTRTGPASWTRTLFALAEGLRAVAIMLWPVIPGSAERILAALGQDPADVALASAAWGAGRAQATVAPAGPLFPRVEEVAA